MNSMKKFKDFVTEAKMDKVEQAQYDRINKLSDNELYHEVYNTIVRYGSWFNGEKELKDRDKKLIDKLDKELKNNGFKRSYNID